MKTKLLFIVLLSFWTTIFLSCNDIQEENLTIKSHKTKIEEELQKEELTIYSSDAFLNEMEHFDDVTFPVLVETPEEVYTVNEEEVKKMEGEGLAKSIYGQTFKIKIYNPYLMQAATGSSTWTPPSHHRPWGGDWAGDLWRSSGSGINYGNTCNRNIFLSAQIFNYSGNYFDALKGKVHAEQSACKSGNIWDGGSVQIIKLYGKKNNQWLYLGWVLFAHLDPNSLVYSEGDDFIISWGFHKGTVHLGKIYDGYDNSCSKSCHLHFEMDAVGWSNDNLNSNDYNIEWNERIASMYFWMPL